MPSRDVLMPFQGQVYSRIIDQVCDASQTDFEEGGVDSDTLKLLKQVSWLVVLYKHGSP